MSDSQKSELIKKLNGSRENLHILRGMLKREQWNVEQELALTNKTEQSLTEILYELTGDDFYKGKEE